MAVMRLRAWRSVLVASLAAALLLCAPMHPARAEEAAAPELSLPTIGFRYTPGEGETCLTRDTLNDSAQALKRLGATASGMLSSMRRESAYLLCYAQDGLQLTLRATERPGGLACADIFTTTETEKAQFLSILQWRDGYDTGTWPVAAEGWALLTGGARATGEGPALHAAALATLYLGQCVTLTAERLGDALTQSDLDALIACQSRLLRLGARRNEDGSVAIPRPELHPLPTLSQESAAITAEDGGLALTLAHVPAVVGTTTLVLTGMTEPGARVRYTLNGEPSSRFPADADGAFTATIPRLKSNGSNTIKLAASLDGKSAVLTFTVSVDLQDTPLSVAPVTGAFAAETARVEGVALPGATVQLVRRSSATSVDIDEEGRFSLDVPLRAVGVNTLVIRATAEGYRKTEQTLTFTRFAATEAERKALEKRAKAIDYAKLLQKPKAFADKLVVCEGVVRSCYYLGGQPCYLLQNDAGVRWLVRCADLLSVQTGASMRVVGALTGETTTLADEGGFPVPSLTLLGVYE